MDLQNVIQVAFWILLFIVVYSFAGYAVVLYVLVKIKSFFGENDQVLNDEYPEITILIAAYNEERYIKNKIENTVQLNYPANKKNIIIVTDGSDDHTNEIVNSYPQIKLLHRPERKGKIAAVDRAMKFINTPIVVFTDANTELNQDALVQLVRHFQIEKVGAVAGEKRIKIQERDAASASGEGVYWKYESKLKTWDSELHTVVGAAGELFAIRTSLFEYIPNDTIIEDFYLTLRIAEKGFKVVYEPEAYAMEEPSADSIEELKRKIRISAGGLQAISRLTSLLNVFKHGWLSFQYVSHRVLRWTLLPLSLPLIFVLNVYLAIAIGQYYLILILLQALFYLMAAVGFLFERKKIKVKLFFIPFYFCMMNYAVYAGFFRLIKGKQSVVWERAARRET